MSRPWGDFITVFTDASYCHKTKAAGWAIWIKYGAPAITVRLSGCVEDVSDSLQAEIIGLKEAFNYLNNRVIPLEGKIVVMQCDCVEAVRRVEPQRTAFKQLHPVIDFRMKWVKGHQAVKCARSAVNTWCDVEAKAQMRALRDSLLKTSTEYGWPQD